MKATHSHYFKPCPYDTLDIYRVISIFGVTDPCFQHALKKLLCTGDRGYKDTEQDVQDVIDTLERWKQMRKEDAEITSSEVISPRVSEVNADIDNPIENWYPDNSGEWVEYDGSGQPVEDGVLVEVIMAAERRERDYTSLVRMAEVWDWGPRWCHRNGGHVVAYKVVKQ